MQTNMNRRFTIADQTLFEGLSGDANPMHMDAVAARRTQAGVPVVHGIHTLLWVLDRLAAAGLPIARLRHVKVQFAKFVPLEQDTLIEVKHQDEAGARVAVVTAGLPAVVIALKFGTRQAGTALPEARPIPHPGTPAALSLPEMETAGGVLTAPVPAAAFASAFPHAAAALPARTLSGLAQTSRLVGMVCPGLHSIYAGLALDLTEPGSGAEGIAFHVTKVDERFRLVDMAVEGDGLVGKVTVFARHAPVAPPDMAELARHVVPGEFAGTAALVAGGSRGLGAVTAMLLAAGGARVTITYARGRQDAEDVQRAIDDACGPGTCAVLAYDAAQQAAPQLTPAAGGPTQLYYFPTPPIFLQKQDVFVPAIYHNFSRVYVDAFHECCQAVQSSCRTVFYPSSVAVTLRPAGMLEYAMAKAAGEMLCAEMQENGGWHVVQNRLPRILTDQTATVAQVESADAVTTMLPLVRAMHGNPL